MEKKTNKSSQHKTSIPTISTQPLPSRRKVHKKHSKPFWSILSVLTFLLISGVIYGMQTAEKSSVKPTVSKSEQNPEIPSESSSDPYSATDDDNPVGNISQNPTTEKKTLAPSLVAVDQQESQKATFKSQTSSDQSAQPKSTKPSIPPEQPKSTVQPAESDPSKQQENDQVKPTPIPNNPITPSKTPEEPTQPDTKKKKPKKRDKDRDKFNQDATQAPAWDPNKWYHFGDTVFYEGKTYEANWSNKNKKPGDSFLWFDYWSVKEF